jgi:hypothetical protein
VDPLKQESRLMVRLTLVAVLGALLLSVGLAGGSPLKGHYREPYLYQKKRGRLKPNLPYEFRDNFRANQRACVIVEGDHEPVMNLKMIVKDRSGNIVAQDNGPGDVLSAIWYPPRTQEYVVTITGDGNEVNLLDIVVK